MGKINRLFKGEIKKIFSGPSIYIMTGLFILALTLLPSFFNPTPRVDEISTITINETSVTDIYSSFTEQKNIYDSKINQLQNNINEIVENNGDFKQNLTQLAQELYTTRINFSLAISRNKIEGENGCFQLQLKMIELANNIKKMYNSYANDYFVPLILLNEDLFYTLEIEINFFTTLLDGSNENKNIEYYINLDKSLNDFACVNNIRSYIDEIQNNVYSSENLNKILTENLNFKKEFLNELYNEILTIYSEAQSNTEANISKVNRENIKQKSLLYLSTNINLYNIIENSSYLEIAKNYSDNELTCYMGFEDFNSYKISEDLCESKYLLENNIISTELARMFSFNVNTTTSSSNAFDYAYYSIEIISLLIIAFTVIIGAGTIAKEYNEGTIKLLAIRPYSRTKIMKSKIYSTLFIAGLFTLIATIVSLIVGSIIYGFVTTDMLVIINASYVFSIPNWLVFIIYLASVFIKILIYSLIAIALSTLFRSYVAAVCTSLGIYVINMIVTFISNGANWLRFNPFSNIDFFKFFGGSFINSASNGINSLFVSPVFLGTNLWITLSIIVTMIVLLNIIIYVTFKKRDIT